MSWFRTDRDSPNRGITVINKVTSQDNSQRMLTRARIDWVKTFRTQDSRLVWVRRMVLLVLLRCNITTIGSTVIQVSADFAARHLPVSRRRPGGNRTLVEGHSAGKKVNGEAASSPRFTEVVYCLPFQFTTLWLAYRTSTGRYSSQLWCKLIILTDLVNYLENGWYGRWCSCHWGTSCREWIWSEWMEIFTSSFSYDITQP